jgi:hypothetical protein
MARLGSTPGAALDGGHARGARRHLDHGCDAANGTYYQLYSDERGVCRVYEMSIGDGQWKLWREGEPFPQRFTATISDDGNTISGRWEKALDGRTWETDFDLTYRKIR